MIRLIQNHLGVLKTSTNLSVSTMKLHTGRLHFQLIYDQVIEANADSLIKNHFKYGRQLDCVGRWYNPKRQAHSHPRDCKAANALKDSLPDNLKNNLSGDGPSC